MAASVAGEPAWSAARPPAPAGRLAAAAIVRAGRARRSAWTWAGSGLVLLGVAHVALVRLDPTPPRPVVLTLLAHATLALAAGLAARRWAVFGRPLAWS